jgi:hypothetical protein
MFVSRKAAIFLISTLAGAAAFTQPTSMLPRLATKVAGQRASSVAMAGLPFGFSLRLPEIFQKKDLSMSASSGLYPIVGDEEIMKQKAHGTTEAPVQPNLRLVVETLKNSGISMMALVTSFAVFQVELRRQGRRPQ